MGGEVQQRFARLQQGDHLCLIAETPGELSAALVPFFKAGLAEGNRGLFIGPAAVVRRIERSLEHAGTPVGFERERGALVLLARRQEWLSSGSFDPGATLDLLRQAEQQALDDGFSGLRISWDLSWIVDGAPGAKRLVELEALLNRFLAGSRSLVFCRYPRPRTPAARVHEALRTHPLAVLGEQICPNSFYEPPGMVLGDPSEQEQVDWMIARLRRARVNDEKLEDLSLRLDQKRAALERADRAKSDLLAMLAHELRNPLGTISNALQVLRFKDQGDETSRRTIEAAERQVLHQALLIDDLLETSRVTRGEIELHCDELDLVGLVRDTVAGYREALHTAGLELDLKLPDVAITVRGDRLRLAQAVAHLLHNAVKFTAPGGRVTVRVRPAPEAKRVEVTVRDNGAGISPEMLPNVFEVFTQADHSLDRSGGGLGVGLAVVKGLVELHGGEVHAASEGPGCGAEFSLWLPMVVSVPGGRGAAPEILAEDGARRVLVVEDNADVASTMRDFLQLSGHQVEIACSGNEGVRAARAFHPQVVLCDLGLPGMDGYEVAEELRRDPETASAQLIAVTGYGRDEDRRRSKAAGFDLHLTKPVDPTRLRQLLRAPLRQHH